MASTFSEFRKYSDSEGELLTFLGGQIEMNTAI